MPLMLGTRPGFPVSLNTRLRPKPWKDSHAPGNDATVFRATRPPTRDTIVGIGKVEPRFGHLGGGTEVIATSSSVYIGGPWAIVQPRLPVPVVDLLPT